MVLISYGFADGQNGFATPASYTSGGETNGITSNVPLNEINVHAFRHFEKNFPQVSGESWLKTDLGYIVSFTEKGRRSQVHYDPKGGFQFVIKYYAGTSIAPELGSRISRKYPDYRIGVVTEFWDGEKTVMEVKIESPSSVKTISVNSNGKLELIESLVNGGVASR
jgi:hypothetical protein